MISIKNLANLITATRIAGAIVLIFTAPFSRPFWAVYLYCGVSDMVDGPIARALRQQSDFGAKLDSIADTVFVFSTLLTVIPAVVIPTWFWVVATIVMSIRVAAYLIGYKKHRVFSALHTYANKATGGALFCMPVLIDVLGINPAGIILGVFATLSACEELLITVVSTNLDRNRKSFFI